MLQVHKGHRSLLVFVTNVILGDTILCGSVHSLLWVISLRDYFLFYKLQLWNINVC